MSAALPWLALLSAGLSLAALLTLLAVLLRPRGGAALERLERRLEDGLARSREEQARNARELREEVAGSLKAFNDSVLHQLAEMQRLQQQEMAAVLGAMRADSAAKLEQIRATVEEKLQGTLEKRLGQSFQLVSERLEAVHKGLGEMQSLAAGVGDLKRVLANVRARGTWGEVQLAGLLADSLTAEQYRANVVTRDGSNERVEFAIRLPGRSGDDEVLLPIDAKFPTEDWERLQQAADAGDREAAEQAGHALENRLRQSARTIATKYLNPPRTTDFALMYLPTEGLYAEAVRRPGLTDELQRNWRVVPAGPTTLQALLNSLQMGFRTLAIERRSSEVWQVLAAVKSEFERFGAVLERVQKKLQEASNTIDEAGRRQRAIRRRLRACESIDLSTGEPAVTH